ncbi:MAG: ABC transporter ATP-binding protein [Solirubrobacteraceae bacterium]|nr:ABC transporter ATP-binding protein [Solirubrobacteraceae bacterium]
MSTLAVDRDEAPLIRLAGLRVSFGGPADAVCDVSFALQPGRALAIVGESGSGKSVTARTLVGLTGGRARVGVDRYEYRGRDVSALHDREWRRLRGKEIGFVTQDALVSLDQLRPVGKEVGEGPRLHGEAGSRAQLRARVVSLLRDVGVPEPELKARQLPHELSGGQRQRALIAAALALDPALLIADEPTTALDVTIQAQVLELLEATRERGKALIIISHDLAVVSRMADDVLVMRYGEVVERGPADAVFGDPQHAYTRKLLDAVPSAHSRGARLSPSSAPRLATASSDDRTHVAERVGGFDGPLLRATGLFKSFRGPDRVSRTVVQDVSFELGVGETLGIVGESGSGKSTTARLVLALERPDAGTVELAGKPWSQLAERERRSRRQDVSVIYQDPLSSFDPRWPIERIVRDSVDKSHIGDGRARVGELLDLVGLERSLRHRRPLELSGGQRQRVAIARAIAVDPAVLVCDEPVSALDVSIQAQVLDLLADLRDELGVSLLFISHDLGVVHHLSDRVLVMKDGIVVEQGLADDVFLRPQHPYTQHLVAAVPRLEVEAPRVAA